MKKSTGKGKARAARKEPAAREKREKTAGPVKASRRPASVEPEAPRKTPKSAGPLAADDLEKGMSVIVVPEPRPMPLEGATQESPYRGTIIEVVRQGIVKGKKTTNPVKLEGTGEVIGADVSPGDKKGWSGFVPLRELFSASYTPPTAAKTTKAGKPRAFKMHDNPATEWVWSAKGKPEFSWDQKTKEPKVARFPKEFKLADMIAASKEAGSSRPEGRAKFIIKALLRKHKIKSKEA